VSFREPRRPLPWPERCRLWAGWLVNRALPRLAVLYLLWWCVFVIDETPLTFARWCAVHERPAWKRIRPILYGHLGSDHGLWAESQRSFPYAEWDPAGGCRMPPTTVKWLAVYLCRDCLVARRQWTADRDTLKRVIAEGDAPALAVLVDRWPRWLTQRNIYHGSSLLESVVAYEQPRLLGVALARTPLPGTESDWHKLLHWAQDFAELVKRQDMVVMLRPALDQAHSLLR